MKGVPLRLEIGPRDIEQNQCVLVRRDTREKQFVRFEDLATAVPAALEALRSFHDEGYRPERAIEFIAFAEEEGSNFGSTCLGSKGIVGQIDVEA